MSNVKLKKQYEEAMREHLTVKEEIKEAINTHRNAVAEQEAHKISSGLKFGVPTDIAEHSEYRPSFTDKTGGKKMRDLDVEQEKNIESKQANLETFTAKEEAYSELMQSRFKAASKMFTGKMNEEKMPGITALSAFFVDDDMENADMILRQSKYAAEKKELGELKRRADAMGAELEISESEGLSEGEQQYLENMNYVIDQYLLLDFDTLDLSSDKAFAENTSRLKEISDKTFAAEKFIDFSLFDDSEDTVNRLSVYQEKLNIGKRITAYYLARKNVITDKYYSSHANDEISIVQKEFDKKAKNVSEKVALEKKIWTAELFKKLVNAKNDADMERIQAILEQGNGYTTDVFALVEDPIRADYDYEVKRQEAIRTGIRKVSSKKDTKFFSLKTWAGKVCSWIGNCFGAVKRTADHGAVNYEKALSMMEKIPEVYRLIGTGQKTQHVEMKGDAPIVDVKTFLADENKTELYQALQEKITAGLLPAGSSDGDSEETKELVKAITALQNYCQIQVLGINDTTEMEMAFIDQYHRSVEKCEGNEEVAPQLAVLKDVAKAYFDKIKPKLEDDISRMERPEYEDCRDYEIASFDNHGYKDNMRESNVPKDMPLFLHKPCLSDITQGATGDCWLLAGLQAALLSRPDAIQNMFHDCGNGDVVVRLYLPADKSTNMSATGELEPKFFKLRKHYEEGLNGATHCMWVQMIEHAMALSGVCGNKALKSKGGETRNITREITAGEQRYIMRAITGEDVEDDTPEDATQFFVKVKNGCEQHKYPAVSLAGHVMTILSCEEENEERYLLIRDPFNTYNVEYSTDGTMESEGFKEAVLCAREKETLGDDQYAEQQKGHRGLSWWKLNDVITLANRGEFKCTMYK